MLKTLFAFDNMIDPEKLASFCLETGIGSAILHPGFFEDNRFINALRRNHIKIWLNIPVFFNEQYLALHPEAYGISSKGNRTINSWLHMVCPSRKEYLDYLMETVQKVIQKVNPDYISYDFIRFFVFWEAVNLNSSPEQIEQIEHGCYCNICRESFRKFSGEEIRIENGMIDKDQRMALAGWKTNLIAGIVEELNTAVKGCAPNTPIYMKSVPWKPTDLEQGLSWIAGQDIERLGRLTDGIIPMSFTQILGQTPQWKEDLLDHTRDITGKEVMSYIQFEPVIRDTPITPAILDKEIQAAYDQKRAGLCYFHYEQIAENPEKQAILKKYRDK